MTPTNRPTVRGHLAIMRFDHWFKNVFVLPGVAAAMTLFPDEVDEAALLWRLPLALLAVGLVSSSNYVVNELLDAADDARHPLKANRPVPSGRIHIPVAWCQWLIAGIAGIALALPLGWRAAAALAALWTMGVIYNVPPVRTKEQPWLDVLSEAINNPLRLLFGWWTALSTADIAPGSLVAAYWMLGAFFMALKRLAELRSLGAERAVAYRRSFRWYDETRLLIFTVVCGAAACLFFGAFTVRYRLELVLTFPFLAVLLGQYLHLGLLDDSPAQRPEQLWRVRPLMLVVAATTAVGVLALAVDMSWIHTLFDPTAPVQ